MQTIQAWSGKSTSQRYFKKQPLTVFFSLDRWVPGFSRASGSYSPWIGFQLLLSAHVPAIFPLAVARASIGYLALCVGSPRPFCGFPLLIEVAASRSLDADLLHRSSVDLSAVGWAPWNSSWLPCPVCGLLLCGLPVPFVWFSLYCLRSSPHGLWEPISFTVALKIWPLLGELLLRGPTFFLGELSAIAGASVSFH